MEVVVEAGLTEFWRDRHKPPPPVTSFLFFQKALVEEVNGDLEGGLQSLLISDALHPRFDATSLNLARLYRKLAQVCKNPQQRQAYLVAASDRLADYVQLAFSHLPVPPEVRQEQADLKTDCAMFTGTDRE